MFETLLRYRKLNRILSLTSRLKKAASFFAPSPILDYEGDSPALYKKITEAATNTIRVRDSAFSPSLENYLDRLPSEAPKMKSPNWLESMDSFATGFYADYTSAQLTLTNQKPISLRIDDDLLIDGSDVLIEDAKHVAETLKSNIGFGTVITTMHMYHIPEKDMIERTRRAKSFVKLSPHYDSLMLSASNFDKKECPSLSFTFLKTYRGDGSQYLKAETLRESFIKALKIDEKDPWEHIVAEEIRHCDYETLMKIGLDLTNKSRKSFRHENRHEFWVKLSPVKLFYSGKALKPIETGQILLPDFTHRRRAPKDREHFCSAAACFSSPILETIQNLYATFVDLVFFTTRRESNGKTV